jgi:murein DD-endopeptidase MepM/ murein hydrolase activator NlpD
VFDRLPSRLLCLALLSILHAGAAHADRKDYRFRIEVQQSLQRMDFVAHNDGPATITAQATLHGDNMESDTASLSTVVVRPFKSEPIGSAHRVDLGRPAKAQVVSTFTWGDVRAVHAPDARYRLPYEEGSTFPISQAYGARLTTHNDPASEHAVDFALPEGTPIVAARDGLIVDITLSNSRGGLDPSLKSKANVVEILHADGTVANYAHLSQRSAPIKVGDRVRAGTLIGYSGDTGYSSGPHLHFAVSRPQIGTDGRLHQVALPVVFYAGVPAVEFSPQRGMEVRAKYAAREAITPAAVATPPVVAQRDEPAPTIEAASPAEIVKTPAPAPMVAADAAPIRQMPPLETAATVAPQFEAAPAPALSSPQSAPAPAVGRTGEAEPAPGVSPIDAGLAFLISVLGLLCLLAPKGVHRASTAD